MPDTIVPRRIEVDFAHVPKHWMHGSGTTTAVANGVNMLFPWGERFFVRSVKKFADRIDDPVLQAQIKGFFGQEGRHAHAHDEFNAILRAQGYEVDRFLSTYKRLASWIEARTPPALQLAITVACEHFTAILAEGAFEHGALDAAAPEMRRLLAWHAAEELEHKAVAFDVLQEVDPSYALRITGLACATILLGGFWMWGSLTLLRQDRIGLLQAARELRRAQRMSPVLRRVFVRGIRQYVRRSFHPNDNDHTRLAADWFAARGMTLPEAA